MWIHQLNSGEEGLSGEQRLIIVVSSGEANVPRSWRAPPPDLFAAVWSSLMMQTDTNSLQIRAFVSVCNNVIRFCILDGYS